MKASLRAGVLCAALGAGFVPVGVGVGVGIGLSGCATSPFQRAGNADDVAAAVARSHPPATPARSLAFLVLGGAAGPRLAAYDLAASKLLWTQATEVTTRVEVGTNVLLHGSKGTGPSGAVVARDLGTGAVLWQRALQAKERLFGYAVDGDAAFLVVQSTGGTGRPTGALLSLDARTGVERWHHELPSGRVAAPAARGGLVAVPLDSQYVLLFDGQSGLDLGQVLSTEEAATFVRALPEGLFYGSRGLFLLGRGTARGSHRSPDYLSARLPAFVRPVYWYDQYRPEQSEYSAIDRNRILWRVTLAGDHPQFRDGLAFVHDYRFFFAFDAGSGALRWAWGAPNSDAVASTDTGRAILFVTADGEIGGLDPITGARLYEAHLPGEVVRGASFDAEGFAPAGAAAGSKPPDLLTALTAIISDPDQRFPALKLFGIEELGRQPGREVTAKLIEILAKEGLAPLAYQKAGEMLVARRDAGSLDLMTAALRAHADFAEKRPAPPVEILARAVGALGPLARALAPDLAAHLRLPETSPAAAAEIARALVEIGAQEAVPALRDFLSIYRADTSYERDPTALVAAAEALLKLGGPTDRALLLYLAEEPHTATGLRTHLVRALGETVPHAGGPALPTASAKD
jgi:outer membrane protein assembly factor BamB